MQYFFKRMTWSLYYIKTRLMMNEVLHFVLKFTKCYKYGKSPMVVLNVFENFDKLHLPRYDYF